MADANERDIEMVHGFATRTDISKREMMMSNWAELEAVSRQHSLPCRGVTSIARDITQARKMVWDHYARKHLLIEERDDLDRFSLPVLNDFVIKHGLVVVPRMVRGSTELRLLRDEVWTAYAAQHGAAVKAEPELAAEALQQASRSGGVELSEAQPGPREDEAWLYVVSDGSNWIHLITTDPKDVQRLLTGAFGQDMKVSYERWKKA
jgi:hypothetical protein